MPDPSIRRMRIVAAILFLALISYIVILDRVDAATLGTLVGAVLITMGFEVGLRLPGRKDGDD